MLCFRKICSEFVLKSNCFVMRLLIAEDVAVFSIERLRHFSGERICGRPFRPRTGRQPHRAEALCFVRAGFQPGEDAFDTLRVILNCRLFMLRHN